MNCQETRKLFEDALDRRLSGGVKRKLDLHLARCRDCRKFYEAEQAEHARWFRAMNDAEAEPPHSLPPDFADRLVTAVLARNKARVPFFRRFRLPRWAGLAATLALLAATFAAVWIGEQVLTQYAEEAAGESRIPDGGSSGRGSSLQGGKTGLARHLADDETNLESRYLGGYTETMPFTLNSEPSTLNSQQGSLQVQTTTIKRVAALMGAAALAAATPVRADGYQFIVSGYPAANERQTDYSDGIALETATCRSTTEASELEARYRTRDVSSGIALNTTEYRAMVIIIR